MISEELDIDKIIDANMAVTDHLLRDAIRGVVIDAMNKAAERAEIMANLRLNGWRQCAVGQKTTQFCGMLEAAVQAEREKVAKWMIERGYATGHGDTIEDLLKELEWQVMEREQEACALIAESYEPTCESCPSGVANAIRARGESK